MFIFENENEAKAIKLILRYVAENTNCYWASVNEIDFDKKEYGEFLKLKAFLERDGLAVAGAGSEDSGVDIIAILYKFMFTNS